jgi:3-oxosteroid 1-dehydrogenase
MRAFAQHAQQALAFFLDCVIPFQIVRDLPDHYYGNAPGSQSQGRLDRGTADVRLRTWRDARASAVSPCAPPSVTFDEIVHWGGLGNMKNWDQELMAQRGKDDMRGLGAGLVAHSLRARERRASPFACRLPPSGCFCRMNTASRPAWPGVLARPCRFCSPPLRS